VQKASYPEKPVMLQKSAEHGGLRKLRMRPEPACAHPAHRAAPLQIHLLTNRWALVNSRCGGPRYNSWCAPAKAAAKKHALQSTFLVILAS